MRNTIGGLVGPIERDVYLFIPKEEKRSEEDRRGEEDRCEGVTFLSALRSRFSEFLSLRESSDRLH